MIFCEHCKRPLLTKAEKEIVKFIQERGPTWATDLSEALDISVANASNRLRALTDRHDSKYGVLIRHQETADSGGIEDVYKLNSRYFKKETERRYGKHR
jgi:predicted transcriptional regulator